MNCSTSMGCASGYVAVGCSALLTVVFGASAWSKLRGRAALDAFVSSLVGARLMPTRWTGQVAVVVAVWEAATAVLLVVPVRTVTLAALSSAAVLLAVLSAGVAVVVRRGAVVPCRCFGTATAPLGRRHLIRNLALLAVALTGLVAVATKPGPAGPLAGLHPVGVVMAVVAAAVIAALVVLLDDLVTIFAEPTLQVPETSSAPVRRPSRARGGTRRAGRADERGGVSTVEHGVRDRSRGLLRRYR